MKNLIKMLFFLLFCAILSFGQSREEIYEQAKNLYNNGKYEEALKTLEQVKSPFFDVSELENKIKTKMQVSGSNVEPDENNIKNQNNDEDLYFRAVDLIQEREYNKAKELLLRIKSNEINVKPLLEQIDDLSKESSSNYESSTEQSFSDEDLYFEAVEKFQSGDYQKAKSLLLKINSKDIDVGPLLTQIEELSIANSSKSSANSESSQTDEQTDEQNYFKALELYQNGDYEKSLKILKTINTEEIDTKPLMDQINSFLVKPELKPTPGEKVDITPFEYKIRKRTPNDEISTIQDNNQVKIEVPNLENEESPPLIEYVLFTILIIAILVLISYFILRGKSTRGVSTISLRNKTKGIEKSFTKSIIIIGRDDTCDFILDDSEASRRHAELIYDRSSKSFEINDLNSTNGVIVNGKKIQKIRLFSGDNIKIGNQLISISM